MTCGTPGAECAFLANIPVPSGFAGKYPAQTLIACRILLAHLSGPDPDLATALIRAARGSGVKPYDILATLRMLAEALGEPPMLSNNRGNDRPVRAAWPAVD